ncbi:unnamed protein product, partial [Phaeothamnion confervicola]
SLSDSLQLQALTCSAWLTAAQAWEVADAFPPWDFARVQAFVALFSRIVDVENVTMAAFDKMWPEEQREALHRLGPLNVLSPLQPDRDYSLDLRSYEQREYAKILIRLAVDEPGENWKDETYRHARGQPPIPGWLLPEPWTGPDESLHGEGGPRRTGILTLEYVTDPQRGCQPNWAARRALLKRCLGGAQRPP